MRRLLPIGAALLLAWPSLPGQEPGSKAFAVRCGTLLLGDGSAPKKDVWLVVRDGKVAGLEAQRPAGLSVVDASMRVVMPGIVAVDSDLGAERDGDYAVTPDVLAVDGFDFEAPMREALEGGVTSVYLSPGRDRLVSGQGAVVKTAGQDLVARILTENACLRMNLADGGVSSPRVFEPTIHPTDEDPLEPSRIQGPTARISLLAEVRALLQQAGEQSGLQGEGAAQHRYEADALQSCAKGELPLRAQAQTAADIRRALLLQREFGMPMTLEDPTEIEAFAKMAKDQGVAAVFRLPVRLGKSNPGGEDRAVKTTTPRLDAPAHAARAGMLTGLAPGSGTPLRDYLLAAALAVRYGMPQDAALRAICGDASRILGVDARVGTLAVGKDADFLILSGEPFAIGTMVESAYVDGARAYERPVQSRLLAIRCGRIHDGLGNTIQDGVLLVQDGRIKAVGAGLPIPFGARVVDVPDGVMTPGFIDAFSHLGLAGDGTGVPGGQSSQLLDQAIAFDDPMFAPALRAGVTTVLVSGKDSGLLSGRVAAVKTGALDRDSMLAAAICGQRAVFEGIGQDADKPLRDAIERGRKYHKAWADYDKALAEYKAGKKPAAPAPAAKEAPAEAKADPVTGIWEADLDIQGRFQIKVVLELKLDGQNVTGKIRLSFGQRELPEQTIETGSFDGQKLRLEFRGMGGSAVLEGTVKDDSFDGTLALGPMGEQEVKARRTSKEGKGGAAKAGAAASDDDEDKDAPKKPDVDAGLEPMRAVIDGRAALVVRSSRLLSLRSAVALLEQEKIPYVLHGADGLLGEAAALGAARPFVLLEPEVVREDGKDLENAAASFVDMGLPVLFGTGDCEGSRHLPLHAAYAVRYGMPPDAALAAVTSAAAQAFKLQGRIGALQRGLDADFVVFSNDPFEPTSRILLVGCNGEIAVDNREVQK